MELFLTKIELNQMKITIDKKMWSANKPEEGIKEMMRAGEGRRRRRRCQGCELRESGVIDRWFGDWQKKRGLGLVEGVWKWNGWIT